MNEPFEYDFTEKQNQVISACAKMALLVSLGFWGHAAWVITAAVRAPELTPGGWVITAIEAASGLVLGKLTFDAHSSLKAITETEGNDIGLLMTGLEKVRVFFMLYGLLMVFSLIGGVSGWGLLTLLAMPLVLRAWPVTASQARFNPMAEKRKKTQRQRRS